MNLVKKYNEEYENEFLHVGDRVRFKSWDQMSQEFKLDNVGDIKTKSTYFTKKMRYLCGTLATVKEINPKDSEVYLKDFTATGTAGWRYDIGMIEKVR